MQLYWLIFLLGALLPSASSLRLYNATEWRQTGSFAGVLGANYNVYKPVCPGRYRLGDVVVSADTQIDNSVIARALVCVSGESSDIIEAPSYQLGKTAGTATLFKEYKAFGGGNVSLVLGSTSLPSSTWLAISVKSQQQTSENDDLRGYGVITSTTCKQVLCSASSIAYNDAIVGNIYFKAWDALSPLNITLSAYFMPLFRFAGDATSEYLNNKCLTPQCFCESDCVNGVCNPATGGCVCYSGWKGTACSEDINECDAGIARCVGGCVNTLGSYYCTCPGGYTLNADGYSCDDINECLNTTICTAGETCVNYKGGYQCNTCTGSQVLVNGVCTSAQEVYTCGNGALDGTEECDGGLGCTVNCTCSTGFTPKNSTDCSKDCGNGVLNAGEECDSGMGCLDTCLCDANQGYQPVNSTSCQAVYIETDACARFSGNCSDCLAFNCLYCNSTNTCATNRISSDCLDQCPGFTENVIVPPTPIDTTTPSGSSVDSNAALVQTVVPAVVVSVAGAVAGVVVLVVLLKRRDKKKGAKAQSVRMSLQRSNSRRMTRNQSKYGIERNTINSSPDKTWEPPADSEFDEVDKMPFDMSKKIDFNVGSNQFKVGQQYTDVITITAKDKKSATTAGVPFAFHPPTTKKLKMEFNPASGIVKKGKPVEVEVTMTVQMTTELDVDIGVECSSEKKHSFITLHLMSELSSFIDLDEVVLEGGSGAKPVGDGAFGVVYKGTYRGQDVAVKMLKMQDMPEEMLDEFDREVDLMNKLRHKNIVQFIGASKVVGRFALVTEFIDKGNLANVVLNANKTLSYGFKLRVALDAARAMFFLHENKILHRDLKLDNLLCVSTNPDDPVVAKLTDFGTSRAVSEKISNSYTVGVGTPMYMSPEILAKKPYDTKSDVFSYGVMLWILYVQKEPYKNIEHSWEIARFVMEGNREKIPKDCPAEFRELIEQCWAQEPSQRPEFEQIVTRLEQMAQANEEPSILTPRSKKK